jgi:hypothetical protein
MVIIVISGAASQEWLDVATGLHTRAQELESCAQGACARPPSQNPPSGFPATGSPGLRSLEDSQTVAWRVGTA